MLDIVKMHAPFRNELIAKLTEVLDSGSYINGKYVEQFENELAQYTGTKKAVGVTSGTDALILALMALDVKPGDEIITTSFTFFATVGSIVRLGAKPVFADIDPVTFNIDAAEIESKITRRTVGIMPVHLFGQPCDMQKINAIASKHKLWVVEDAAQSIGALQNGVMCGAMSTIGTYSFFPAKNLGCIGDGGACVTNDAALGAKMEILRNHGMNPRYYHKLVGGNFRLDALQAAVLSVKLPHLKAWETKRRAAAQCYETLLAGNKNIVTPIELPGNYHVYNQYELRVLGGRRDSAMKALTDAGIASAIYYPVPLHLQECFTNLGGSPGDLPITERACEEVLAVPIMIGDAECRVVAEVLNAN